MVSAVTSYMPKTTDERASDEPEALDKLLRKLAPMLLGLVRSVLGRDHPDIEDALQETLVAVTHALPKFEGRSSVSHYASRIAVRTALQIRKRKLRWLERAVGPESVEGDTPYEDAVALRRRRKFFETIDTLPEEQAETLMMRIVLGYSLKEVAAATQCPVNTVRSRVRLGKAALRARIEADATLAEELSL